MDATSWNQRYRDHPSPWSDRPNPFLEEFVVDLTPSTALVLACGEGRNALWLSRQGWHTTGVDFSDVAIGRATEVASAENLPATFECADVRDWATDRRFALVTLIYLHLPEEEMATAVASAAAKVDAGGTLFIVGHHPDNIAHGYGGPQAAHVLWSEERLADWAGLPPIRAERVERGVATEDGTRTALDALLIARRPGS